MDNSFDIILLLWSPLLKFSLFLVLILQEFTIETVESFVPATMVSEEGFFCSYPHEHQMDGAFAARMRRAT